jgi:AraC-like DNA-binding protein
LSTPSSQPEPGDLLHILEILASGRYAPDHVIYRGYVQVVVGLIIEMGGLCEKTTDQSSVLIRDILTYLQEHYLEEISLNDLAQHSATAAAALLHLFNASFQTSLSAYLNSLRCRHAASLLLDGTPRSTLPFSLVLIICGPFIRAFRACYQRPLCSTAAESMAPDRPAGLKDYRKIRSRDSSGR